MMVPNVPAATGSSSVEPPAAHAAVCPLCHTADVLSDEALERGADWRCSRCGQLWDARRLGTVASFAAWERTR